MGFLSMKPLSGYDIKKLFDMSAAYFWPADQTQVYRTLKRLAKDGMVELKEQKKGETVDRKVYAITDKGRAENLKQIQQSTMDDFISRDAFLMQLFEHYLYPQHGNSQHRGEVDTGSKRCSNHAGVRLGPTAGKRLFWRLRFGSYVDWRRYSCGDAGRFADCHSAEEIERGAEGTDLMSGADGRSKGTAIRAECFIRLRTL